MFQAKHARFYKHTWHDQNGDLVDFTKYSFRIIDRCNDIINVVDFAERISFAEHGKLVAESSEFHLTLNRAHRVDFFPTRNTPKKWDILSEKRDGAKKSMSLRSKAVMLTPMLLADTDGEH